MSEPDSDFDTQASRSALESLRNSEERYRSVVEHLGEGMFVAQNNRIVFSNRQASEIMHIPNEEMLGSDPVDWIHPDDRTNVLELRSKLLHQQEIQPYYELRHIGKDAVVRWLHVRPIPVPWEGGRATLTFFYEITDRKAMEKALERSQERYRAVIEHVDSGMVVLQDDRLVYANRRAAEIVRMSRQEVLDVGFLHAVHPDDHALIVDRRRRRLAGEDVPNRYEVRLLHSDGSICWIELGVSVVPWDGRPATITFFSDVTARRKAEQDTLDALEQQKELNELRSRFVAMTSHEFRTPLATILSSAELLKYYGDRLPKSETQDILKTIEDGVHRMTRMLDRVLLLGKVEAHMLEFKPDQVDLVTICQSLIEDAVTQQPDSKCVWVSDFSGAPNSGLFDEKLLRHIFSNLLSNAMKYSPQGGVARFQVTTLDGRTVFEVSDQGIGIPAEEIPHLFESFHRASNVGDILGTGLGLAIVKNAVDMHGGEISVRSAPGLGTCFTVRI